MTKEDISLIVRAIAPVIKESVAAAICEVQNRITTVELKLESLPAPKDGTNGLDGKDGENGRDGQDGKDAPPVDTAAIVTAVREQITAELKQIVAELPKPQDGRDGRDGRDGVAKDGRDGKDGKDGEPGRDAVAIEILEGIDETKTYTRGTFATHLGGLWMFDKTWRCIVRGQARQVIHQDSADPRTFTVVSSLSDGTMVEEKYYVPVSIYKGVFKDGTEYIQGDQVTWHGSTWHCNAKTSKAKPGTCDDWQMSVRKGNDGKDLREAKDVEPLQPVRLR